MNEIQSTDRLFSDATVIVNVIDINDNTPIFEQDSYTVTVSEFSQPGDQLITVKVLISIVHIQVIIITLELSCMR